MANTKSTNRSDCGLTAREAAAALGVSPSTLYAYVSRGMLRSAPAPGRTREKRYSKEDVARLLERKEVRREPAKAADRSLHWGAPAMESSLTLIEEGRLYYRGRDALDLARRASIEEVASLLWKGDPGEAGALFSGSADGVSREIKDLLKRASQLGPVERCQLALPLAAAGDPAAYDLRPTAVARTGARILHLLVAAICGGEAGGPMDVQLQEAWSPRRKAATSVLRSAIILCADHELNVSTFTARCIASAEATPYEVVIGGLAALKGRRHGGHTLRVDSLFQEAGGGRLPREILADRLRQGEGLPGFGHPLYPDGDPRAAFLLSLARTHGRGNVLELAEGFVKAARGLSGEHPTVDFALTTLARAFSLPAGSALALFSLGRAIGWIAHAIEQYADRRLIRPRARYIGPPPG